MFSIIQIIDALEKLGVDTIHLESAFTELKKVLADLDEVEVKGRDNVDTLLGCMMAVESIIGDEKNG